MQQLTQNVDIQWVKGAVAAGSSIDDDSGIVDTAGWDGVCFIAPVTDSVATGKATVIAEQNSANSGSGMAALAGAKAEATCAINDDLNGQCLIVDVYRPAKRYVRVNRASVTANIAYGDVIAILYRGRKLPPGMANALAVAAVATPAEV